MLRPKIFISYRHEDGYEAAGILDAMLKRTGLETLRDTRFAEGSHLDDAVLRGLAAAKTWSSSLSLHDGGPGNG